MKFLPGQYNKEVDVFVLVEKRKRIRKKGKDSKRERGEKKMRKIWQLT